MYYQSSECNPISQKKKKKKVWMQSYKKKNLVNARCSHWAFGDLEVGLGDWTTLITFVLSFSCFLYVPYYFILRHGVRV